MLMTAGVAFPLTAAISGASYLLGRVIYMEMYSTGKPDKRYGCVDMCGHYRGQHVSNPGPYALPGVDSEGSDG